MVLLALATPAPVDLPWHVGQPTVDVRGQQPGRLWQAGLLRTPHPPPIPRVPPSATTAARPSLGCRLGRGSNAGSRIRGKGAPRDWKAVSDGLKRASWLS